LFGFCDTDDKPLGLTFLRKPQKSSCNYICQYCLVHLGDIARYRNQNKQSESFYRYIIKIAYCLLCNLMYISQYLYNCLFWNIIIITIYLFNSHFLCKLYGLFLNYN